MVYFYISTIRFARSSLNEEEEASAKSILKSRKTTLRQPLMRIIETEIDEKTFNKAVEWARREKILIPTLEEQKEPEQISPIIREALKTIGPSELHPLNLFRMTWKNSSGEMDPFGEVNYVELPREITGVRARIFALLGDSFPAATHGAGSASFSLLARLLTGQISSSQKALWPYMGERAAKVGSMLESS